MTKQKMQFAVLIKNGVITNIGKSQIYQPKTDFKVGEIKWFDDTKLIRKEKTR